MNRRFEIKYLVDREAGLRFMRRIEQFWMAKKDKHAPNGPYTVESVYFDDSGFTSYKNHLEGCHTREKVRLRWYPRVAEDGETVMAPPFFLEIKKKSGYLTSKERKILPTQDAPDVNAFAGSMARVMPRLYGRRLRPTVIVKYLRHALEVRGEHGPIRITLDTFSRYKSFAGEERWKTIIPANHAIIELKFTVADDSILKEISAMVAENRQAHSKYVSAMNLHLARK